jgi:septum formation protein
MLLLASASPARRRLLLQVGIPHRVRASGVDEQAFRDPDPCRLVRKLARAKAIAALDVERAMARAEAGRGHGLPVGTSAVLGCDSVLELDGDVYGKPATREEAIGRWQGMAGRWGELHTGHCLLRWADGPDDPSGLEALQETITTRVLFAPLNRAEIEAYVSTGEPLNCAGGFALEGAGGLAIERIEGCFSNVIGLSLPLLRRWMRPWSQPREGGNP